jgi:UDP-glucuronate 4-epimerase
MLRDFTYIDDVVEAVARLIALPPEADMAGKSEEYETDAPCRIFNIGNNRPVELLDYIKTLEKHLGRKARLDMLPMQPGDVPATTADMRRLERVAGFRPTTTVDEGVRRFVEWYRGYYGVGAKS